jgi:Xaa-Pro aminopeptidase
MWPTKSPREAFSARRQRLGARLDRPALFASGFARPRNFPNNRYPFRAESHFLYLIGRHIEGAALLLSPEGSVLYAPAPDPAEAMWTGPEPTLENLSDTLGIEVRDVDELRVSPAVATLPAQDLETTVWLAELLDRDLEAGGGADVEGADLKLAEAMIAVRLVHDEHAIAQLRQAAEATTDAHLAGMAATEPGLREADVRAAMEARIIASGMTCSYGSIVTVHGEVLHNETHTNRLTEKDLVLADVGAETPEGWAGDVTRTWPTTGRFSPTQRAVYEVVLAAQSAALASVGPGVRYLDVHRAAGRALVVGLVELGIFRGDPDDLYARGAAGVFFPHGVGHLLGLDVHDMEDLGDRAGYTEGRARAESRGDRFLRLDRDLEPGMAVTIEPGFYQIEQILRDPKQLGDVSDALNTAELARYSDVRGIRIEDDVLVTATGSEVLTRAIPKSVSEVEAAVR